MSKQEKVFHWFLSWIWLFGAIELLLSPSHSFGSYTAGVAIAAAMILRAAFHVLTVRPSSGEKETKL